jgi:hypothetical protein
MLKLIFFLTNKNEIYINIKPQKQVDPSAQGVLRGPTKVYKRVQKAIRERKNQSIPKQVKGLDHQQCILEARAILVVLNHRYENNFTLSKS